MKKYYKFILFGLIGSAAGYAYYHYYGCTGGCPLTSKWYVTTIYGALMGAVLGITGKSSTDDKQNDNKQNDNKQNDNNQPIG